MVSIFEYSHIGNGEYDWVDVSQKFTYEEDINMHSLGLKTRTLLQNKKEFYGILRLLQDKYDRLKQQYGKIQLVITLDRGYTYPYMSVNFYDEDDEFIDGFNIIHSFKFYDLLLVLQFATIDLEVLTHRSHNNFNDDFEIKYDIRESKEEQHSKKRRRR